MKPLFIRRENKAAINSNSQAIEDFFDMKGDKTPKEYTELLLNLIGGYMQSRAFKDLSEENENVENLMFDFRQLVLLVSTLQNPIDMRATCNN